MCVCVLISVTVFSSCLVLYYILLLSEVLTLSIYSSPDLDEHLYNHYLEHFFFFFLVEHLSLFYLVLFLMLYLVTTFVTDSSVSLRVLILCALLFIRFCSFHFPVLEKWPYPGDAWRAQQHIPWPAPAGAQG